MEEYIRDALPDHNAAKRSRFNEKPDAPDRQKDTITYHFVKQ